MAYYDQMQNMYSQPAMTDPYVLQSQQLPNANVNPYMQNISDQQQNQAQAYNQGQQLTQQAGQQQSGGGEQGKMMAAALRTGPGSNPLLNALNQGHIKSGLKYDTNIGSDQTAMLAAQEAGMF